MLFFFSSVWQLYIRDLIFEIWLENINSLKYYCEKGIFPLWNYDKISMFCHFRKLENFKIFIGDNIKSYNETSWCSNLVQYLKFERNISKIECMGSVLNCWYILCELVYTSILLKRKVSQNYTEMTRNEQKRSTEGCLKFNSPEARQVQERLVSTYIHKRSKPWRIGWVVI